MNERKAEIQAEPVAPKIVQDEEGLLIPDQSLVKTVLIKAQKHSTCEDAVLSAYSPGRAAILTMAVADGLGSDDYSDIASGLAVRRAVDFHGNPNLDLDGPEMVRKRLVFNLVEVNQEIVGWNEENDTGAKTTIVAASIFKDQEGRAWLVTANVGDSRAVMWKGGKLKRITREDSAFVDHFGADRAREIEDMIKASGNYKKIPEGMTEEERSLWRYRQMITATLGVSQENRRKDTEKKDYEYFKSKTEIRELDGDEIILLMSDGAYENISDEEISEIMSQDLSLGEAVEEIKKIIEERRLTKAGKDDDISISAVRVSDVLERKNDPTRPGTKVQIKRNDGNMEEGWEVDTIVTFDDKETHPGKIKVSKIGGDGQKISRWLRPEDIKRWNQE